MGIGAGQLLLIILAILLLFGAGKLPNVMADLAKGIRAFKKGMTDEDTAEPIAKPVLEDSQKKRS